MDFLRPERQQSHTSEPLPPFRANPTTAGPSHTESVFAARYSARTNDQARKAAALLRQTRGAVTRHIAGHLRRQMDWFLCCVVALEAVADQPRRRGSTSINSRPEQGITGLDLYPVPTCGSSPDRPRRKPRLASTRPHAGSTVFTMTQFFSPLGRSYVKSSRSYRRRVPL